MDFTPLKYSYRPSGKPGAHTLLLLHGTGGNERDLLPLADYFGTDINVLSVRGNVSENGMPRFFRRIGMGIFDEKDLEFRTAELIHFLHSVAADENFDVNRIVALGYSNGANIAGAALVLEPDFLAGAVLLRPMRPFADKTPTTLTSPRPVLMISGKLDATVDPADPAAYAGMLRSAGFEVAFHELPAGHNLTQSDLDLASDWFKTHFKS